MATETELKLCIVEGDPNRVSQSALIAIEACLISLGLYVVFEVHELKNSYFDTPDWQLHARKIALRIRNKSGCFIQTLKTKGQSVNGLSQRGEWEWQLAEPKLNLLHLRQCDAWPDAIQTEALVSIFETNFTRRQAAFEWQGSRIELALDQGVILSKGKTAAINEIELELLEGNEKSLHLLYKALQEYITLAPSDVSKAERGYHLFES